MLHPNCFSLPSSVTTDFYSNHFLAVLDGFHIQGASSTVVLSNKRKIGVVSWVSFNLQILLLSLSFSLQNLVCFAWPLKFSTIRSWLIEYSWCIQLVPLFPVFPENWQLDPEKWSDWGSNPLTRLWMLMFSFPSLFLKV